MAYYFGFLPSEQLNQAIDVASSYVAQYHATPQSTQNLSQHRDAITQLICKELLDTMLVKMIDSLPDGSDRKAQLRKISHTIDTTANKLVAILLSPTDDKDVLPSFDFLQKKSLIVDSDGRRRVGFLLNDTTARQLLDSFVLIRQGKKDQAIPKFTEGFAGLSQACLQHFLVDFTQTLKLGTLKKAAIPLADSVINKGVSVAVHKLLPQLPQEGLERIANYYEPMLIQKPL